MANDDRPSRKVKDDGNTKSNKKNASPASIPGSADASGLRRSGRETSLRKQTTASPSNTRKSERIEKRTPPSTPPTKKSERIEKQMGASPLRRSDRGKNHFSSGSSGSKKSVEIPASSNIKSKKEKVASSTKRSAVDVSEDSKQERQDPDVGDRKRKRMTARGYKALFKPQRIRIEADDDKDPERQVKSPQANSSSNQGVDKELKRPYKLPQLDNNKSGCSVEDRDDGVDKCSDRVGEESFLKASEGPCRTSSSSLKNLGVEVDDQFVVGESDSKQKIGFAESHKAPLNSRRVEGAPDKAVTVLLDDRLMDLDRVEHVDCPSPRKPLDGKSTESGNADKEIGGKCSSFKRKMSTGNMDWDACANSEDNHISHTSPPSSGCKKHDYDGTCFACLKKQGINHELENQQELDSCDNTCNRDSSSKIRGTSKTAGVMEHAGNNDAATLLIKKTSSDTGRDNNGSTCISCKLGGQLRCCDTVGCNRCYHLSCLDPPMDNIPLGIWHCPVCLKNIKLSVPSVSRVAESIWDMREVEVSDAEGLQKQKQYFVKYKGLAHIHNQWVTEAQLLLEALLLVENFSKKDSMMKWNKAWTVPHQLLKKRLLLSFKPRNESQENAGKVLNYHYEWLVKWQGLDYGQATWELENASVLASPKGQNLIKKYENRHGKTKISASPVDKTKELSVELPTIPADCPLGMDRIHLSYVKKLHDSWTKGQSRVVFDNQDRATRVVLFILSLKGVTRPFLIITPSNSLSQWEAMFLRVAQSNDLKVSVEDREAQRSVRLLEVQKEGGQLVFQVLLYPMDAFVKDLNLLKKINWEATVVDESQCSEISTHFNCIKSLSTDNRLLLFGGPLGESVAEYLNVLSLLGYDGALSNKIGSKTESDDSLGKLKETLSLYIAYECKSDSSKFVEFWVPVQISNVQLEQYCATLLSNAMALRSCSKSDTVGALHDILISNRKCCDHPYIVDPDLQRLIMKDLEPTMLLDVGIKASGKLQFLDLILPEVKKRQLRVLILLQPTGGTGRDLASIGDILDDFVDQRFGRHSYERVGGVGIVPSKKQTALDNFNTDMNRFIFLLEHRARLPSIKLSSVDIIVIFDSDLNPANDLRLLQKISIDSRSEQIMIFRLYSSCTLEEKILRLAENNVAIDSKLQNLSRSTCDALLMWGASYLFNKLSEFHSASVLNISSEESFLNKVIEEFLYLISHKCKSKDTANSIITRVQQNCGTYCKSLPLHSEIKTQLPDGEQPHMFWKKMLEGRNPRWKFITVSTPRQRKRPQYFEDSSRETIDVNADVGKKRKKTMNNSIEPAVSKPVIERETGGANEGASGVHAHNGSQSSPGDGYWSTTVHNERSLHHLLKPNVSSLCKILKFSEDVKIIVERFLEYVLENYRVNKEPTNTLQAFMISLCWIGSSLSKYKIDRKESFALAKKHLNFSCKEEEANSVYSKLETAKEMFLRHTENQKKPNASKACIPALESENHELSNEETLQSIEQMPNKCKSQMENLDEKNQKEIDKFNREWDERRVQLEDDYKVDKALIRTLHSNPSVRSEKLKSLDKEFANKLEEHERMRDTHLKDLKATQLAAEGQMAANRNSSSSEDRANNELPLHGSQHENQIVHSGDSKHGSHDSLKTVPTSSGNPMEVQSQDKAVHDMDPTLAVPADINVTIPNAMAGGSICTGTSISLKDPDGGGDKVSALSLELVGARIEDQPKRRGSSGTGTNNVVANGMLFVEGLGTTNGEQPNRVGNSSDGANNIESTSSHTSEKQMAEATISGVPTGEIPVEQHDGIHNDVVGHVDSVEMEVPALDSNKESAKGGTISPDASHAVKDHNDTCPYIVAVHDDSARMGVPAANCNKVTPEDSTISPDTSHAAEDQNDSCGSSSRNSPSAAASQEKTPSVQLFVSPASDHSVPTILEIQNESVQPQQLTYGGIQDKEGQANSNSLAEVDVNNLHPVSAVQVGQINSEDSSLKPHEEPSFPLSTNPPVADNQADILPASGLLPEATCEEPTLPCHSGGPNQSAENHASPSDHAMLQSRGNLEEHPLVAAETPLGEQQPHLPSSDTIHDQPSVEPHNSAQNPEAPPLTADIPNQDASRPELNLFDVQGSDNHNQVASRMPDRPPDPLQAELERLYKLKDNAIRCYEDRKLGLKSEYEKEIAETIAQINLKYEAKRQDAEAEFHLEKKELDINLNRVVMNKILAEAFRSKCQDLAPSGHTGMQQVTQAGLMQQLHRLSLLPSRRRLLGVASSSPGQSSGGQQITPPPLQIVHQAAALFSSTPSRPPPNINLRSPSSTPSRPLPSINPVTPHSMSNRPSPNINPITPSSTPSRPPPSINPVTSSSMPSRPPPGINPITPLNMPNRPPPSINPVTSSSMPSRPPPGINPITPSSMPNRPPPSINPITSSSMPSRPLPSINPITPSSMPNRPPPGINPITPSSMPNRPPPSINPITASSTPNRPPPSINPITPSAGNLRVNSETRAPAPHIRPLVNSDIRAPAPHIRPLVSSDIRAPAPHIRPFRPSASVSPHDFTSHLRMLPSQHVTSSLPLTSPLNSQASALPPLSSPLVQPPPSPPPEASSLPPAPASARTPPSASSRLPSLSQSPRPPPSQASFQSPAPPSLLAHHSTLPSQQHPPSSLPATSSSLPHASQSPLPQIPSISTSHTGLLSASPRPESGGPPLPTADNLYLSAPNLFVDIDAHRHQRNILPPPPDVSSNFDSLDLTEFGREGSAHSSSGHDLVCLSDDD